MISTRSLSQPQQQLRNKRQLQIGGGNAQETVASSHSHTGIQPISTKKHQNDAVNIMKQRRFDAVRSVNQVATGRHQSTVKENQFDFVKNKVQKLRAQSQKVESQAQQLKEQIKNVKIQNSDCRNQFNSLHSKTISLQVFNAEQKELLKTLSELYNSRDSQFKKTLDSEFHHEDRLNMAFSILKYLEQMMEALQRKYNVSQEILGSLQEEFKLLDVEQKIQRVTLESAQTENREMDEKITQRVQKSESIREKLKQIHGINFLNSQECFRLQSSFRNLAHECVNDMKSHRLNLIKALLRHIFLLKNNFSALKTMVTRNISENAQLWKSLLTLCNVKTRQLGLDRSLLIDFSNDILDLLRSFENNKREEMILTRQVRKFDSEIVQVVSEQQSISAVIDVEAGSLSQICQDLESTLSHTERNRVETQRRRQISVQRYALKSLLDSTLVQIRHCFSNCSPGVGDVSEVDKFRNYLVAICEKLLDCHEVHTEKIRRHFLLIFSHVHKILRYLCFFGENEKRNATLNRDELTRKFKILDSDYQRSVTCKEELQRECARISTERNEKQEAILEETSSFEQLSKQILKDSTLKLTKETAEYEDKLTTLQARFDSQEKRRLAIHKDEVRRKKRLIEEMEHSFDNEDVDKSLTHSTNDKTNLQDTVLTSSQTAANSSTRQMKTYSDEPIASVEEPKLLVYKKRIEAEDRKEHSEEDADYRPRKARRKPSKRQSAVRKSQGKEDVKKKMTDDLTTKENKSRDSSNLHLKEGTSFASISKVQNKTLDALTLKLKKSIDKQESTPPISEKSNVRSREKQRVSLSRISDHEKNSLAKTILNPKKSSAMRGATSSSQDPNLNSRENRKGKLSKSPERSTNTEDKPFAPLDRHIMIRTKHKETLWSRIRKKKRDANSGKPKFHEQELSNETFDLFDAL